MEGYLKAMRAHRSHRNFLHAKRVSAAAALASIISLAAATAVFSAQQAGGVQASGPRVKMVRSVAGSKGDPRGGSFVMADPRTTFYVPDDRQVIVYFEWEAPTGTHHCEGTLRGPNGQLAVMSSFDYPATQKKFGGFWTIPLLENTSAGVWTFESRVDGESAGNLSFEIVSSKKPTDVGTEEILPTPAEIYTRARAASVLLEKVDAKGHAFDAGSGFFLEDGLLITSFRVIDAAHTLRITLSDGSHLQAAEVAAWNRRQDWVILKVDGGKSAKLRRVDSKSISIGDHCYWLDAKTDGGRVISDGQIVGKESHEGWGERLSLSGIFNSVATGGPVLNNRGEVLGLLGGTLPESFLRPIVSGSQQYGSGAGIFTATGSVVPIGLVNSSTNENPTTLETLWATGQFSAPVTAAHHISFGMITRGKPQKGRGKDFLGKEMNVDFTRQDEIETVVVAFQGIDSWKSTVQLRIYDADNHVLISGAPVKISLGRGETQERSWSFPLAAMHPGIYKADALVGEEVAWREYFRVRE
jgi:S1-C subfamily serine protease